MRFVPRFVVLALLVVRYLPAAVPVTITSNPGGLSFEVDGGGCNAGVYTTPQTLNWTAGASCIVTIRSAIRGWQDGATSNPRTIVAPSQATTYSAISTLALPPAPGNYGAIQIATGKAYGMNNYGQVVGAGNGSAFLWTPVTPNGMVGSLVIPGDSLLQPTTAAGINDRGQVVGSASTPFMQAILWTPDAPNATSGTAKAFLGGAPVDVSTAIAINSFGQIAGINDGNGFIWTPTSPNGNAGTINQDSRFGQFNPFSPVGFLGINDFGQAITNADPSSIAYALFTPTTAHGATGTFTPVSGVPGFTSESLNAINSSGTILGSSCTQSNCVGFIWTPAAANGATGTVMELPAPPGYVSLSPTAMNSSGQVVGTLTAPVGNAAPPLYVTPFLYSGGTLYDLSTLGDSVANGTPAAINDQGQIVFNTSTGVYLATLGTAPEAPGAGSVPVTIAVAFDPAPTSTQHVDPPPFTVIGTGCNSGAYIAPQTLYWVPGSPCTVIFPSLASMQIGARSLFQSWQDGPTAFTRVFAAPAQAATYTAVFTPQYLVTAVANPPGGGTVSGGGWYTGGSTATLNATPASAYRVLDWSPPMVPANSPAGTLTVYAAQTVTAYFEIPTAPAPNYLLTQMASYFYPWGINNYGQVVGQGSWLWTPVSPNSPAGSATSIAGLDSAGGINDVGQVVGSPGLWTPDTPNGISGTVTPSLGGSALNNYGQIVGGFLWTPSSPNATTGTFNNNPRFAGARLINDFGQVVIYAQNGQAPTLFTPSVAHGSTGTFTLVSGLPEDSGVTAINRGGTILGAYNNISQTFLWIPTTANGTTGSVVTIPPPPSYLSMTPTALNAGGQVVGTMRRTDGVPVPFLYSGGTVYDLSNISLQLTGATPIAINDRGQIVVTNAAFYAYLLTPGAAPPPPAQGTVPVTITADAPLQAFTVAGSGCVAGGYVVPQTLYWTPGSTCTVTFVSPQYTDSEARYVFANWQDGVTANPRVFVALAQATSYSASFELEYLVTVAANPIQGGTVLGGGWYQAGSPATLTAVPAAGYSFADWSPADSVASRGTSAIVTVNQRQSITARFVPAAARPPGNYQFTQLGDQASPAKPINNFGQVVVTTIGASASAVFLWTPVAPNSNSGNLTQVTALPPSYHNVLSGIEINNRGQLAGNDGFPFLWSPSVANGPDGTSVNVLAASGNGGTVVDINDFGQLVGQLGGVGFLWTPSAANGSTGTLTSDGRFNGAIAINNFGQAIMNSSSSTATLFTPSTANGSSGTFTPIAGLAGAAGTQVQDINANGTIVGTSCMPGTTSTACVNQMFLWTPATANGTTGAATAISTPAGPISISPYALNSSGQVVGALELGPYSRAPFLYTGGTVYDLSVLYTELAGYYCVGINDAGQLVLTNNYNSVKLLTPETGATPPAPVEANPASGTGQNQMMTFTFSDPRGWQDLDVVNILINNFLDGRNACYLAYSRTAGVLYLVNDAGTALSAGLPLNGSGSIGNSQCSVAGASSSASGNGVTLTLTLNLSFSAGFGGNKVIYMAARDVAGDNSRWQPLGVWQVPTGPSTTTTSVVGMSPAQGTGLNRTFFTFSFADTKGYQDLGVENILIASALDGRHACYLAYDRGLNVLYLVNDNGDSLLPGQSMGAYGSFVNSQCGVDWESNAVTASGNNLSLSLEIQFGSRFGPGLIFYLAARDGNGGNNTGWQAMGTWTVR